MNDNWGDLVNFVNSNYSENLKKNEEIKYFLCSICGKLPVISRIIICGCRFCDKCLRKYICDNESYSNGINCPNQKDNDCKSVILLSCDQSSRIDDLFKAEIYNLKMQCPKCKNIEVTLSSMLNHSNNCETLSSFGFSSVTLSRTRLFPLKKIDREGVKMKISNLQAEIDLHKFQCEMEFGQLIAKLEKLNGEITEFRKLLINSNEFIWKIKNISDYLTQNYFQLYSKEFYCIKNGYNTQLMLYSEDSDQISVAVAVISGRFDFMLKWPAKFKFQVQLFDFTVSKWSNERLLEFVEDSETSKAEIFPLPVENEMLGYSCCKQFITVSQMGNFTKQNALYLKCVLIYADF